ncbi:polymeric immunoglobulin receptor-like, partial [Clarias magur]
PVDCSDVIGYSGGSVTIISKVQWYSHDSKYICKVKANNCTDIIRAETKHSKIQDGRFKLFKNTNDNLLVLIRKLKSQDTGLYRFGLGDQSVTVNLIVYSNAVCDLPLMMNAFIGQNIMMTCSYPGKYETYTKRVTMLNDDSILKIIVDTNTKSQNSRFSISDDRSAKVLRVNISSVTRDDEGFYLLGVRNGGASVQYNSYFTEMWLHVTASTESHVMNSAALTETSFEWCFGPSVTISVCFCAILLLIGGFGLMMYKLRHKTTQDYRPSLKIEDNKP